MRSGKQRGPLTETTCPDPPSSRSHSPFHLANLQMSVNGTVRYARSEPLANHLTLASFPFKVKCLFTIPPVLPDSLTPLTLCILSPSSSNVNTKSFHFTRPRPISQTRRAPSRQEHITAAPRPLAQRIATNTGTHITPVLTWTCMAFRTIRLWYPQHQLPSITMEIHTGAIGHAFQYWRQAHGGKRHHLPFLESSRAGPGPRGPARIKWIDPRNKANPARSANRACRCTGREKANNPTSQLRRRRQEEQAGN